MNDVAYINGESYDLSRLQTTGVDSVVVTFDPMFTIQDDSGNVAFLATADVFIIFKKGRAENGSTRYYAIK